MERIIAIGDVHGYDTWKRIVDKHYDNVDRIIFVGDYVDSFQITGEKQLVNLLDIIELKKLLKDKLVLLIGNHDYHYMDNGTYARYSGFQAGMLPTFKEVFTIHKDMFQIAYKDEMDTIYSHAGISETWLANVQITSSDPKVIVESINKSRI